MRRYDSYKPSGISWINEIPSHWEACKIRSLYALRSEKVSDKDFEPLSVSKQGITLQLADAVKTDNGDNRKLVKRGDFVVNSRSDRKGSCGVSDLDGSVSLINIVTYPISPLISQYFHLLFRSNGYIEEFYRLGKGIVADLWTTKFDDMRNIVVPFPPLDEQKKIVEYLSTKTSQINAQQQERERELQLLEELKQAEIANVVTRGLNPDVPMKAAQTLQFSEIPAHWQERKFQYCFTERSQKGFPNEPMLCATQSQGVIPQSMYANRVVVVNKDFDKQKLVKVGDFVISLRSFEGGIEYAYYQGIISAAYTILTPREVENSDYFKVLFKSFNFIQLLQTCVTGIREGQNINYQYLSKFCIPIPPIEEQKAIVEYIQQKNKAIDEMIANLRAEIDFLTEYKQRLIADVVTGQLKVD